MNQKEGLSQSSRNRKLFKLGSPVNAIRINSSNGFIHEITKFLECWKLASAGKDFLTEAEFKGGRADIVDLSGEIIEVVSSEKEESIEEKKKRYPLPIRVVKCPFIKIDESMKKIYAG